jgi:hypothetical protein
MEGASPKGASGYRDAHFTDPTNNQDVESGSWQAGLSFHVHHGVINRRLPRSPRTVARVIRGAALKSQLGRP